MADKPIRLQLSRAKGFNLQAHSRSINGLDAVVVARPGPFGNPWIVKCPDAVLKASAVWGGFRVSVSAALWGKGPTPETAVRAFKCSISDDSSDEIEELMLSGSSDRVRALSYEVLRQWRRNANNRMPLLRGKNLACWCKLGAPCHADVLLDLANRPICEEVSAHD